jgi:hypothetical protein
MKKIALPFVACLALASSAFAGQEMKDSKDFKAPAPEPCFKDQEFQLDLFGSYTDGVSANNHGDGFGGGIALNYFFIRNVGVGVDGNLYDGSNADPIWSATGRVIVRFPIDNGVGSFCLAPYLFGGGGIEGDGSSFGTLHAGGGLEWRATQTLGIFGEGRYTWGESSRNSSQARIGVRFVF